MPILSLEVDGDERRILRTRIKRPKFDDNLQYQLASLHPTSKMAKQVWKGRDNPQSHEQYHSTSECAKRRRCTNDVDGAISNGKSSTMPAKHILELVLDTLQRRDSYEIFAEPVDPDEVEDYYEIIKEPMDFGTMRAKLHEGMYHNLEQFEHDAFLIPENAMHFNSSATIYFRQGSAIYELAKKVFPVLKTDPENFALEFSGARRRSMRKAVKSHDTNNSTRCCIAKTSGSDVSSSLKGTLTRSSVSEGQIRCSSGEKKGKNKNTIPTNFSTSGRRVSYSCEGGGADRRFTYLSWKSSDLRDQINYHPVSYTNCKPLMMLNATGDNSYKDSLMSFAKQLGPVAQMVANRKLMSGQHDEIISVATNHVDSIAFGASLGGSPFLRKMSKIIDLTEEERYARPKVAACGHNKDIITKNNNKGEEKADKYCKELKKLQEEECVVAPRSEIIVSGGSCSSMKRPSANSFRDGSPDDQPRRPVILALENYHTRNIKKVDAESRNKKSRASALGKEELIYKKNPCTPLTSQFTFDIPFLKARLQRMQGFYKSTIDSNKLGNSGRVN